MSLEEAQSRRKTIGRNDPCTCGSEKKYKKCHQIEDDKLISAELQRLVDVAEAAAAAEAAEEEEGKADDSKAGAKGETGKGAPGKRGGKSAGKTSKSASKRNKAQSLPRRGAV